MPKAAFQRELSYTQNRELSWLRFNARVLEEAADSGTPLLERLNFVAIFNRNLEEFLMVRAGRLLALDKAFPWKRDNKSGKTPGQQLELIFSTARELCLRRDAVYSQVAAELEEKGIAPLLWDRLSGKEKEQALDLYKKQMLPCLSPQIISGTRPLPHLENKALYAAALLERNGRQAIGIVEIPSAVPALLPLSRPGRLLRTEELALNQLHRLFPRWRMGERCLLRAIRSAEPALPQKPRQEKSLALPRQVALLLRRRQTLPPLWLEAQGDAPRLLSLLGKRLHLKEAQLCPGLCPLRLEAVTPPGERGRLLRYPAFAPQWPLELDRRQPLWPQIQKRDLLLFYPYHTMEPFLALLSQAAEDPQVVSVEMTVYRLAKNSAVARCLQQAARRGKQVTVAVELRARFDEQNNLHWARELERAGCQVIYGFRQYKCHGKLCLITRREENGSLRFVTQVGTGNYNEKTAKLYTDFSLLTSDPAVARDAQTFFQQMRRERFCGTYEKLLVAPRTLKPALLELMDQEIARGSQGHIVFKVNSVTERELIDKLAQASQAGVRVELIVRGICCLLPGVPGKTDRIAVTSIVGRFLEHSRVYAFGDGESRKIFLSSADLMTRNQTRRVEIALPVEDPSLRRWLSRYLEILSLDTVKARRLLADGSYGPVPPWEGRPGFSSQDYFLRHPPRPGTWEPLQALLRGRRPGKRSPSGPALPPPEPSFSPHPSPREPAFRQPAATSP